MITFLSDNQKINSFINNELLKYESRDILAKDRFKNYKDELFLIDTTLIEEKLNQSIQNIDDFDYLKIVNHVIFSIYFDDSFDSSKFSLAIMIPHFELNEDTVNIRKIINNLRLMHLQSHKIKIDYESEGNFNFSERIIFDNHKIEFISLNEEIIYRLKEYLK